ncbi:phytoene desaturase family protein [Georgenia thermotolerans]|uniref:Pyridine nucleotide-disulfide oxidoreductase domain-containing protein 2 n=1 Tax=Georgenia thermotolerans TaxID=527326 RepID=A0A7J5UUW7_9MICO|nr:NAD(P)/FAD-dependent oxidoreductase [Georgenia thermotolerans]KAE8766084.1 FAD-dependent oxidoreductase [Georgenia thermotolerans]
MRTCDAVVIGAGHNGLVTALYLARAGWDVVVLEANDDVGGATRSGEVTEPGLVHDLYATNLNLFLASPVYAELREDLARTGFRPVVSERPYASVFPGGKSLRVYQDAARTERELGAHSEADLAGWRRLRELQHEFMTTLMPLYGTRLPSRAALQHLAGAVRRAGVRRLASFAQLLACSTRELGERWFATAEARSLLAAWGMHLDYGPDVSFGAMFPFVETFGDMEAGIAIAEGGVSSLPRALGALVEEAGGEVRTGARVERVVVEGGRARGVVVGGEHIAARRAVVAGTAPVHLYGDLLDGAPGVPATEREQARRFSYGPGTMMVHLALDGPIPWSGHPDLASFAYVHVGPYVDDLARTYTQSLAGLIPDSPLLVVGQTSQVDPSRSPDGRQVVWVQVRSLPSTIRGDAAGEITADDWDAAKEAVADRVVAKIEAYAPGFGALVRARTVLSPLDLERSNANLVGGDSVAGSHHVAQNFLFRPWLGASGYVTGVPGLYQVGAATWPGAGTNALSGYLCAELLLRPTTLGGRALAGATDLGGRALAGATSLARSAGGRARRRAAR